MNGKIDLEVTRRTNAWLTAHGMSSSSQPATVDPFSIDHDARVPVPFA